MLSEAQEDALIYLTKKMNSKLARWRRYISTTTAPCWACALCDKFMYSYEEVELHGSYHLEENGMLIFS